MSYEILYKDRSCVVINKPAGVYVYNPPGQSGVSIANWWIKQKGVSQTGWRDKSRAGPSASALPQAMRAGIVHRLDKDTSGALLLAKNQATLEKLQKQFARRATKKQYIAVVFGKPDKARGEISSFISRDKDRRTKRKSKFINFLDSNAQKAVTRYKVIKTFRCHPELSSGSHGKKGNPSTSRLRSAQDDNRNGISVVKFNIKTGRTHQIRLHAKMLGTPILGDADYGTKPSRALSQKLGINRQLLHARELTFISPHTHKKIQVTAPIPDDLNRFMQ